jgi:hypothetical protein
MSKEFNCFDFNNSKQKKHYEKWKKLINNLTDKTNEKEKKDKAKTFEDFFPVDIVIKYNNINNLNYQPFLEGA